MYLGIDVGGMSIKCGLVDENGKILYKKSIPTTIGDPSKAIAEIAELAFSVVKESGMEMSDIKGVGTGIPGTVHNGVVSFAGNLNWYKVPYAEALEKLLGVPCYAGNDANCALLGEWKFGAAKGEDNVMAVTIGTGIGNANICDGKMLLGNGSAGTEGGHMRIKERGKRCSCGRYDCYELYASTSSLLERTKELAEKEPDGLTAKILKEDGLSGFCIFKAEKAGDKNATKVIDEYISDICDGLVNYVNIFRPDMMIIGGGISAQPRIIEPLEGIVNATAYGGNNNPYVKITTPVFFNDAGIIGAACLAIK